MANLIGTNSAQPCLCRAAAPTQLDDVQKYNKDAVPLGVVRTANDVEEELEEEGNEEAETEEEEERE
jgi:hypothetical protein